MPKFVIERSIPGAGKLTPAELQAISATSCNVLRDLGPSIQWVQSYVTEDKIYCVAGVNYLDRPATTILAGWKRGMISL